MPSVLVPLDETPFAESILFDAQQLAGPDGRLVLVSVVPRGDEADDAERYLTNEAELLRGRGGQVTTKVLVGGDIPRAIDAGVTELGVEMVAIATHGKSRAGRLAWHSLAWQMLVHSPVPILIRHVEEGQVWRTSESSSHQLCIMVPLDGSPTAERSLPIAGALAAQWHASLVLAQIDIDTVGSHAYLDRMAQPLTVPVQTAVGQGKPSVALAQLAAEHGITHVVMTSHGRSGLSWMIAGDVAAGLIEQLSLPIIVVPVLAQVATGR